MKNEDEAIYMRIKEIIMFKMDNWIWKHMEIEKIQRKYINSILKLAKK